MSQLIFRSVSHFLFFPGQVETWSILGEGFIFCSPRALWTLGTEDPTPGRRASSRLRRKAISGTLCSSEGSGTIEGRQTAFFQIIVTTESGKVHCYWDGPRRMEPFFWLWGEGILEFVFPASKPRW